jgi:iron complex transport system substrate-binding protein
MALAACGTIANQNAGPATSPVTPAGVQSATTPAAVTYPLTITDGAGRQVRIERAPQRIVSYLPSNTETLFALGVGDRIVGVDDFSDHPADAKSKPRLGGLRANLEALVALQPDLVVTIGMSPDFPTLLEGQQIPVIVLAYKDIPGTLANIELLGRVVGKPSEATKLVNDIRAKMEAIQARVRSAPKVRVYFEIDGTDPSKPYVAGPGSLIDGFITMAAGTNVAAGATGTAPQLSVEEIVRANPQLILVPIGPYSPPNVADPTRFAQRPGWEAIDAVKSSAVRGVDETLASRPGPRLAEGLEVVARAMHPDLMS